VNRFGSNYLLSGTTKGLMGQYLKQAQDVVITEINVSGLDSSYAKLSKNDSVTDLALEGDYALDESGDEVSWHEYTYTFPAALFADDAYYRVMLTSSDVAGNLSENLMEGKNEDRSGALNVAFAVDGTAPRASFGNVEGNAAYYGPSHRIDIHMGDNMEAESGALIVDGQRVAEWSQSEIDGEGSFSYDLGADHDSRMITLEVTDKAGNVTNTRIDNVFITNDIVRFVINTPAIFYPVLAGLIVLVSAAVLLIGRAIHKRNKRKQEELELLVTA